MSKFACNPKIRSIIKNLQKAIVANATDLQAANDRQDQKRWDRIAQGKPVSYKIGVR
jgi:hypothetical protein